jgi:protein-S-isoprenylcysteine O-methyltransferase Ste14
MASKGKNKISIDKLILSLIYVLIWPALLLYLSKDWHWIEGWIFGLWFLALCYATIIYLYRNDSELLAERFKMPGAKNQKKWDKYFILMLVILFTVWFIIIPFDAKRYHWTANFPVGLKIFGGILLLPSFYLFFRSYVENTFLSSLVRIQIERKQQVVSTGVYGFVRHPMYLGASLLFIGAPLLLASKYGLLMGLILLIMIAGRIIGEERMLVSELDGYAEYKKKVQYRLIPLIW